MGSELVGVDKLQSMSTRAGTYPCLNYQSPAVERAKPFFLVCLGFRRLDSMKMLTLFAGMGSANKYPWAEPQPANANSRCWSVVSTPSATTLRSRLRASPTIVLTMASVKNYLFRAFEKLLVPMVAAMRRELITGTYIQADETPVDVQHARAGERITKRISGNTVAPEELWCSTSV
jgi:hypothetical protein